MIWTQWTSRFKEHWERNPDPWSIQHVFLHLFHSIGVFICQEKWGEQWLKPSILSWSLFHHSWTNFKSTNGAGRNAELCTVMPWGCDVRLYHVNCSWTCLYVNAISMREVINTDLWLEWTSWIRRIKGVKRNKGNTKESESCSSACDS